MNKNITCLLIILSLIGCKEIYEDNFKSPITPLSKVAVNFPGLANFELIQSITPTIANNESVALNEIKIRNTSGRTIELTYLLNIYGNENRQSNSLLFTQISKIKLEVAKSDTTLTISNDFNGQITKKRVELEIIEIDFNVHPLSGIYTGSFVSTLNGDTLHAGTSSMFVNYTGECRLQLPTLSLLNVVEGFVTPNSTFRGLALDDESNVVDDSIRGAFKPNIESLNITLSLLSSKVQDIDTLLFTLSKSNIQ